MDENYVIKTRQTRQLIGELNRIGGIGPRFEVGNTVAKPSLASDSRNITETLKVTQQPNLYRDAKRYPSQLYGLDQKAGSGYRASKKYSGILKTRLKSITSSQDFQTVKCPEGLEYLIGVTSLFIAQEIEPLHLTTGIETDIRYVVQNIDGERLFFAMEQSTIVSKLCLCSRRPFEVLVFNIHNKHIMTIRRPYKCCYQKATIYAPPDVNIGSVEQKFTCIGSLFVVKNLHGDILQKLRGPKCSWIRCRQVDFQVLSNDGQTKLGFISTDWEGLNVEQAIDTHCLGIAFPEDLDCETKVLLLGAIFLLNIIIYESSKSVI